MNTEKHRFKLKNSAFIRVVPWLLTLLFGGCNPEEPKVYPQDELTVEYTIDRDTIMVGDPVELVVTAYYPTNGTLELPEIGYEKDVVLLKRDWNEVPREDGLKQSESRYSITSFRLGEHLISTGTVFCTVGNQIFEQEFPQVMLNVQSSLTDASGTQLADIKPVHKLPGRIPRWVWIVPGAALIAFLVGLITAKVWRNREKLIPSPPPIPAHVIAFHALEALKNKGLLEKNECNPFYTELSMILRNYLDGRFALNATDETTEEIVEALSKSPELNTEQQGILRDFMTQADMVKFAKGHPDRTTMEAAYSTTKQFVEETMNPSGDLATKERIENKRGEGNG